MEIHYEDDEEKKQINRVFFYRYLTSFFDKPGQLLVIIIIVIITPWRITLNLLWSKIWYLYTHSIIALQLHWRSMQFIMHTYQCSFKRVYGRRILFDVIILCIVYLYSYSICLQCIMQYYSRRVFRPQLIYNDVSNRDYIIIYSIVV